MTEREALTLALEALEQWVPLYKRGTVIAAIREALAQQEPVIDKSAAIRIATALGWEPKRTWQGLTMEERRGIREWQKIQEELGPVWAPMMLYLYDAIEAKLKEKNHV